jgi:hypothetical protein
MLRLHQSTLLIGAHDGPPSTMFKRIRQNLASINHDGPHLNVNNEFLRKNVTFGTNAEPPQASQRFRTPTIPAQSTARHLPRADPERGVPRGLSSSPTLKARGQDESEETLTFS